MTKTIWNSDKFAADDRPDWVRSILRGGHNVTAFLDAGRWYFEPSPANAECPIGYAVNLYKDGMKIPAIWDGEKFLDMREPEGRLLREKTVAAGLAHLKEYGGAGLERA